MDKRWVAIGAVAIAVALVLFIVVQYEDALIQAQMDDVEPYDLSKTSDWRERITFSQEGKKNAFYVEKWNVSDMASINLTYDPSMGAEVSVITHNIRNLSINLPEFFGEVKGQIVQGGDDLSDYEYREIFIQLQAPLIVNLDINEGGQGVERLVFVSVNEPEYVDTFTNGKHSEFTDWDYLNDNIYTNIPNGTDKVYIQFPGGGQSGLSVVSSLHDVYPWLPIVLLCVGALMLLYGYLKNEQGPPQWAVPRGYNREDTGVEGDDQLR